jgi:riboflavin kinase / FMN adenylyltransferase
MSPMGRSPKPGDALAEFQSDTPVCLAIGNFDGVHQGHQALIQSLLNGAKSVAALACVLTFEPHPRQVLKGPNSLKLLQSYDCKVKTLISLGLDQVLVADFTSDFARMSQEEFVDLICEKMNLKGVWVGYNFSFGSHGKGNPASLSQLLQKRGVPTYVLDPVQIDGVLLSSGNLRNWLAQGSVAEYLRFTGRHYQVSGLVIRGEGRGQRLGFPTANLDTSSVLLGEGVYIASVGLEDGSSHRALVNLGQAPTFGVQTSRVEVFIPELSADLYGSELCLSFLKKLRDICKFSSSKLLQAQIQKDLEQLHSFA